MKSIIAKAVACACIMAMPAMGTVRGEEPITTYGQAQSTLKELIRQARDNIVMVDNMMEAQRIAEQNAAREAKARELFEAGNERYAASDLAGAKKAWSEALRMTGDPAMKGHIAAEAQRADERAAQELAASLEAKRVADEQRRQEKLQLQAKIEGLTHEGEGLFGQGRFADAEATFREVLLLDAANRNAKAYVEVRIPAGVAELDRVEEAKRQERKAMESREQEARRVFEEGRERFAAGDLAGARVAWSEALAITSDPAMKSYIAEQESLAAAEAAAAVEGVGVQAAEPVGVAEEPVAPAEEPAGR